MIIIRKLGRLSCQLCCHTQSLRPASTTVIIKSKKLKNEKPAPKHFVDFKCVKLAAGSGGDGSLAFLSLPRTEWAGPDGGDGGNGGHIIFQADGNVKSLENMNSLYKGNPGQKGGSKNCTGKNAEHLYLKVPIGTLIRNTNNEIIADLKSQDDYVIGARGGAGGHGNKYFLSNEVRAPTIYERGAAGEEIELFAELRIVAHVGLVGFPNAGKSTLLRALSRARPKVAAYPFTTLNPHVGMVEYPDTQQVAVADLPGLICGAHENKGLGFSFLRHIERCLCLLYVIDMAQDEPWTQLHDLKHELEQYQPGLSDRPHAVVANKMDISLSQENIEGFQQSISLPLFPISAKKKENIQPLIYHIRQLYDKHKETD